LIGKKGEKIKHSNKEISPFNMETLLSNLRGIFKNPAPSTANLQLEKPIHEANFQLCRLRLSVAG
jgi:hypothetical protein